MNWRPQQHPGAERWIRERKGHAFRNTVQGCSQAQPVLMQVPGSGVDAEGARALEFQAKEPRMLASIRKSKRVHLLCLLTENVPRLSSDDLKGTKSRDWIVGYLFISFERQNFLPVFYCVFGYIMFLKMTVIDSFPEQYLPV